MGLRLPKLTPRAWGTPRSAPSNVQPRKRDADEPRRQPGLGNVGAFTFEVGVITGDLTVTTTDLGTEASITVQYTGADEWYHLQGGPTLLPEDGLTALHHPAVEAIRTGGGTGAPQMPHHP